MATWELLSSVPASDTRCQKILVAAKYANIKIDHKPSLDPSALTALVPHGKTVVLKKGNDAITQSNAILRLLAELAPQAELYGKTEFQSAEVDQWLEFFRAEVEVPAAVLTFPALGLLPKNAGAADMAKEDVLRALGAVERHLAARTWLVGERPSLADVAAAVAVAAARPHLPRDRLSALVNTERWFQTCAHQPAFAAVGLPGGARATGGGGAGGAGGAGAGAGAPVGGGSAAAGKEREAAGECAPTPGVVRDLAAASVGPGAFRSKFRRNRTRLRELLADAAARVGTEVTVKGWVRTMRSAQKNTLLFVELNDGSCFASLQVVAAQDGCQGFAAAAACGGAGASLAVTGRVVESPAQGQAVELQASLVRVLGVMTDPKAYPLSKKFHTMEHLREVAHLRARARIHSTAMRVRHEMALATHQFFHARGFAYIHTPLITSADCEGAGEQFVVTTLLNPGAAAGPEAHGGGAGAHAPPKAPKLPTNKDGSVDWSKDFFGRQTCLTVSGQLNVETHACAMSDVYTFGPTFRAENSHTSRHLAEFWMIEPEMCFADIWDDMDLAEDYLKHLIAHALAHCQEDLEFLETFRGGEKGLRRRLTHVLESDFVRITYTEAIELLQKEVAAGKAKFEETPEWGIDMGSEHERYLTEQLFKKPTIVRDYPKDIKAFYMKLNPDGRTVAAMDILVPKIGEIIGGSEREADLGTLTRRAAEMGLSPEDIWWYLDLRKYGTVKHCGFGLGFERLILFITGIDNIRDVIPFPRHPGKAEF